MHEKFAQAIIGGATSSPSQERLDTWSKTASNRFVGEGIPLNDSIKKIAQSNDLNPHFIERVCEMSNLYTHNALLPSEPEKRAGFAFPLADAKTVIASLRMVPKSGPAMKSDYACPPSGPKTGPTMAEMFGSGKPGHDGFQVPEKKRIIIMIQKKAAVKRRVRDALLKTAMEVETAELHMHKQVKQAVMQGMGLEEIHQAACSAGLGEITQDVLPKTAKLLNKQFLVKDAELQKLAFEAPEELIDRDVPVTVINGRNSLMASIDVLKQYRSNASCIQKGLMGLEQEVEYLKQRLKELE